MKKNYKSIIILCILSFILVFFITNYETIINEFLDYTNLFIIKLLPSSFIFILMSNLLIEYRLIETISKKLKINSIKLYVLILSIISGFPGGVKNVKDLLNKKIIEEIDANKLLMFVHNPNFLFVLGPCGKIINNNKYTIYILISIILSNIIISIPVKTKTLTNNDYKYPSNFIETLIKSIKSTINIIIVIFGINIFFYLTSLSIINMFIDYKYIYIIINCIFDLTKGISSTILISNTYIKAIIILLSINIGSISIHMQTKSILTDTNLNYKYYIRGRIISSSLSLIIFNILTKLK